MRQVLCFGDSNTYGYVPGTAERYDWDTRWTGIVGTGLMEKGYIVQEEGLCGRTTVFDDPLRPGRRGSELLPIILETHKPEDLIILMLGTNDCKTVFSASPDVIGKGIRRLLIQAKQYSADSRILLVSPIHLGEQVWKDEFDPEFSPESVEVSRKLTDVYRKIADEFGVEFLAASSVADSSEADQEHMNPEGHAALAGAIEEKIYQMAC
mgnify:CR=1 FL=1